MGYTINIGVELTLAPYPPFSLFSYFLKNLDWTDNSIKWSKQEFPSWCQLKINYIKKEKADFLSGKHQRLALHKMDQGNDRDGQGIENLAKSPYLSTVLFENIDRKYFWLTEKLYWAIKYNPCTELCIEQVLINPCLLK